MSGHHVFVYGTLKKGQPNEYAMTLHGRAEFLGRAVTADRYPLVIGTAWNLPQLIQVKGRGEYVKGEVYSLDDTALAQIDYFEGHPDLYERRQVEVRLTEPRATDMAAMTTIMDCWTYFYKDSQPSDLDLQCHDEYDSKGSHGLQYDISENEDHPDNITQDAPPTNTGLSGDTSPASCH